MGGLCVWWDRFFLFFVWFCFICLMVEIWFWMMRKFSVYEFCICYYGHLKANSFKLKNGNLTVCSACVVYVCVCNESVMYVYVVDLSTDNFLPVRNKCATCNCSRLDLISELCCDKCKFVSWSARAWDRNRARAIISRYELSVVSSTSV